MSHHAKMWHEAILKWGLHTDQDPCEAETKILDPIDIPLMGHLSNWVSNQAGKGWGDSLLRLRFNQCQPFSMNTRRLPLRSAPANTNHRWKYQSTAMILALRHQELACACLHIGICVIYIYIRASKISLYRPWGWIQFWQIL